MRLEPAVIDAHCHSLPGLDDVAHTVETAIEMPRQSARVEQAGSSAHAIT